MSVFGDRVRRFWVRLPHVAPPDAPEPARTAPALATRRPFDAVGAKGGAWRVARPHPTWLVYVPSDELPSYWVVSGVPMPAGACKEHPDVAYSFLVAPVMADLCPHPDPDVLATQSVPVDHALFVTYFDGRLGAMGAESLVARMALGMVQGELPPHPAYLRAWALHIAAEAHRYASGAMNPS